MRMGESTHRKSEIIVAVDPTLPGMSRIADALEAIAVLPGVRTLSYAFDAARVRASSRENTQIACVLPSTHLGLIALAVKNGCDRIAAYHSSAASFSQLGSVLVRAAFAMIDLTIVPDATSERSAVSCGADPSRTVRADSDILNRLLLEPRRGAPLNTALEVAMSLALDAAEITGLVRLAELASPDQGVNVVNYHRILPLDEIATYCRPQMALAEPVFEAQLEAIEKQRGFADVTRIRERAASGNVAITFDDGYEDNFRVALPILLKFSVPACIFVVTNLIGKPGALWWDRVGLALFAYWRNGAQGPIARGLPARANALLSATSFFQARSIISEVLTELNHAPIDARELAVNAAESLLPAFAANRTMLSWEEIRVMAMAGIKFGSHTRNHVPLDEMSAEAAREELFGAQRDLNEHLDVPRAAPKIAALPRGKLGELEEGELRRAGFQGVMTTEAGVNPPGDRSIFVLRRDGRMLTLAGRHHPAKLRIELTGWTDRLRRLRRRLPGTK